MFFDRKSGLKIEPANSDRETLSTGIEAALEARTWPWDADRDVAAKYAIGSLHTFFLKNLAQEGRLQVETLFSTVGALTGFAAQHAVRQEYVVTGRAKAKETEVFAIVESKSGGRYYLGDQLNAVLVPERRESLAGWSIIAGEAMRLGASKRDLPDCIEIFDRVVKSIGTLEYGIPQRIPGHGRPWLMPRQAIEIFWQVVFAVFVSEPVPPVPDFKQIEQRYWPLVLAMVAARYLSMAKAVFPPALAVGLYMEAAISMSKIDPGSVKFASGVLH